MLVQVNIFMLIFAGWQFEIVVEEGIDQRRFSYSGFPYKQEEEKNEKDIRNCYAKNDAKKRGPESNYF